MAVAEVNFLSPAGGGETILLQQNVTGDKSIDLTSIISNYAELTTDNFIIMIMGNGTASANDSTKTGIRYHDIFKGDISYNNTTGILSVTGPLVRTNGRSYNTVITNLSYNLYLMQTIGEI